MPKVHSVTVSFDGDKHVYEAGDAVSGQWTVNTGDSFSVKGVRVALCGAAYARWEDDFDVRNDDKVGYEKFTSQWKTVFGTKLGENGPNHTLTAGEHKYRFRFRLPPDRLPSSYEGKYGAIRYWVLLQIDRPLFRFNIERMNGITVLDRQDVNQPQFSKPVGRTLEKTVRKALVVGNEGTLTLEAQTNRGAYCPGEKISLKLEANNKSERDLATVKASLVQRVTYYASGEERLKDTVLRTVTGKTLEKGITRVWNGQTLTLDAIPPSTKPRACHIVNVSYHVKVYVVIPKLHGGDATVYLPITVGTVPQGHRPASQPAAGASNIAVIDASSAITYTGCSAGIERFQQGESPKFPKFLYTPWCAYVPDFKFPTPAAKPKATAATNPTPMVVTPGIEKATEALSLVPAVPKVPTAPPAELPPSYDDVISGLVDFPIEQTKVKTCFPTTSSQGSGTTPVATKPVYLVLRFPDSYISVFRMRLVEFAAGMHAKKGSLIALAAQVIVTKGTWPARTSVALFAFESGDNAKEWFAGFQDSCSLQGLVFTEAVVAEAKREHEHESSVFLMTVLNPPPNNDWKAAEVRECLTQTAKLILPLRQEYSSTGLMRAPTPERLSGTWPPKKYTLSVSQWQAVEDLYKFKHELRTAEKYKKVVEQMDTIFKPDCRVIFQSEDLSFIEETMAVYKDEDCESDTRTEEL